MTQRDGSDLVPCLDAEGRVVAYMPGIPSDPERAGGDVVTPPPHYPQRRGGAAGSLSVALELVREMRFDVAQLRLQLADDDRG